MEFKNLFDLGIEFEFCSRNKSDKGLVEELKKNGLEKWSIVHDGSTETPALTLNGVPLELDHDESNGLFFLSQLDSDNRIAVCGGEIISPILSGISNEYQKEIESLCNLFKFESYQKYFDPARASIHVHINVGDSVPLYVLHNLVKLALRYEPFLYKIGGFGEINRGVFNNFVFCRPINSPPIYKYGERYFKLFLAESLLTSTTKTDFFNFLYNSVDCINRLNKYVPQRYVGLNFYSVLVRNSLEFRYANITTVPEYLMAWIKLCQNFVKTAYYKDDIDVDIIRTLDNTSKYNIRDFDNFLEYINISEPYRKILLNIFMESPDIKESSTINVLSHVETIRYDPQSIKTSSVRPSTIKTVHPTNYRDFVLKLETMQRKISINRDNMQKNLQPNLSFFIGINKEPAVVRNNFYTTSNYTTASSSYSVSPSPTIIPDLVYDFYNQYGQQINLSITSSVLEKLAYIKRKIVNEEECFFFPIFSLQTRHTFTIPRGCRIPFLRGQRISFMLDTRDSIIFSLNNFDTRIEISTTGDYSYCDIIDVLSEFLQRFSDFSSEENSEESYDEEENN